MLAAIRRASSRESRCAAERLPGFPKDSVRRQAFGVE